MTCAQTIGPKRATGRICSIHSKPLVYCQRTSNRKHVECCGIAVLSVETPYQGSMRVAVNFFQRLLRGPICVIASCCSKVDVGFSPPKTWCPASIYAVEAAETSKYSVTPLPAASSLIRRHERSRLLTHHFLTPMPFTSHQTYLALVRGNEDEVLQYDHRNDTLTTWLW